MHFFHLIQQSASHIYHSALPLSPESSTLRSFGKTLIRELCGFPNSWGAVIRTISNSFICMTTFGDRIAAACQDGTVGIYDTATGVLKLSLSPPDPVQAITGPPDGSMLFCTHRKPSITAWDLQTGGLIHTLVFEGDPEDTAISLQGRYLACGLSNGSVKTWELASMEEGGAVGSGAPVACLCWLQPEERLAVAKGRSVGLWDVVAGRLLYGFAMQQPIRNVAYARGLGILVVVTSGLPQISMFTIDSRPEDEGAIATARHRRPKFKGIRIAADSQQSQPLAPYMLQQHFSCFAFSQTTREFVCGGEISGLELFGVSSHDRRLSDHPVRITSVSALPDGIVVANVPGAGIQLLNLDKKYAPSQQPSVPTLAVRALDHGNIIAAVPASCDRIVLLETATMSELHTIPAPGSYGMPFSPRVVLCASLKSSVAVCSVEGEYGSFLELWKFRHDKPEWTMLINQWPLVGGISPAGARVVTLEDTDQARVCMWDARDGQLQAQIFVVRSWPVDSLEIEFESEDWFSSQHDAYHIPYYISPSSRSTLSHSIIRHEQVPSIERRYHVDNTREWIVYSSKKVCWIPPGYIGSAEHSYCWAGNSLVMVGQDKVLRKLTLESDFERWGLHAEGFG